MGGRGFRIALRLGLVLVLVGLLGYRWLLDPARVPSENAFDIGLEDVRRMARTGGGALPTAVDALVVAESVVPRRAVVASSGFEDHPMIRVAYRLRFPDQSIVIDSAMDRTLHEELSRNGTFHPEAWQPLQDALGQASAILITHEHADHLGGISRSPQLEQLAPRLLLTREQLENRAQFERSRFPEAIAASLSGLEYARHHRAAPGVVLIKAPGHTPGTQMIYVQLQDGRELLFVGDIAWHMDNVDLLVGRPRLVSQLMIGESRDAVFAQLAALHELARSSPVALVVSHDADQLREHVAAGRITLGFD